ncbi:hypothetical protein HKX48_001716 [Thoreauomyces humboldtii]|nr:hypothetical protein HKX48_001716 [Thoreauomyces humboldtii]
MMSTHSLVGHEDSETHDDAAARVERPYTKRADPDAFRSSTRRYRGATSEAVDGGESVESARPGHPSYTPGGIPSRRVSRTDTPLRSTPKHIGGSSGVIIGDHYHADERSGFFREAPGTSTTVASSTFDTMDGSTFVRTPANSYREHRSANEDGSGWPGEKSAAGKPRQLLTGESEYHRKKKHED